MTDTTIPRYTKNAFGWWLHDFFVHPFVGSLGLLGRLCVSLRLITISHHIHNNTAPSNDSVADYMEAMKRACHNETIGGIPWHEAQARGIKGEVRDESRQEAHARRENYNNPGTTHAWTAQEELKQVGALERAKIALRAFENKSAAEHFGCGEHWARQIAQNPDHPKMVKLRKQYEALKAAVDDAGSDEPLSLRDVLNTKLPKK